MIHLRSRPFLLTGLALLLTACAASQRQYNPDWPTLQNNASHTGMVEEAPRPPLQLRWSFKTEGRIVYPPVVMEGLIYLGSRDSRIYALNIEDGAKRWDVELEQGGIFGSPAVTATGLYAGKSEPYYYVYSWNRLTGADGWSRQTGELISRPPWVLPDEARLYTHLDPEISSGENVQTRVAALSLPTGETIWQTPMGGVPEVAPALSETLLLVAGSDSQLYALDRVTGALSWQAELSGKPASAPLVHQGRAYVSTVTGFVYALEIASGKVIWRYQFPEATLQGNLALSGKLLLIPGGNRLYSFDTVALEPRWSFRAPSEITSPVASREHVYFGCSNQILYALKLETGAVAGQYRTGGEILASPVLAAGLVLVGSSDGKLYAFEEQIPKEGVKPPQQPPGWMQKR